MMIAAVTLAAALSTVAATSHIPTHRVLTRSSTRVAAVGTAIPINQPYQMALDAQGNLYVANCGTNNVLVYSPTFVQQTARTIATPSCPIGVAVDPYGNVFASDNGASQVTEYDPSGRLSGLFTTGLREATSIAVDALDDLYVVNNAYSSLSVFQKNGALVQSYRVGQPAGSMTAVTVNGPTLVTSQSYSNGFVGSPAILQNWDADSLVTGKIAMHPDDLLYKGAFAIGMAVDVTGGIWVADQYTDVIVHQAGMTSPLTTFRKLNYAPQGIAVDSVRGLIYVSDITNNLIHVYNTNGQTVAHIQ